MYIRVSDTVLCVLARARGGSVHGGCLGEPRTHTRSRRAEGYRHGLGRACECPLRGGVQRRLWAHPWGLSGGPVALTASWRSSRADSVEWPPSSACRRGSRQGHSQRSGSAAPAARTPAPAASVSHAGPRAGPAGASGAPVSAGSHSEPGLGLDGCPGTLQRDRDPQRGPAPCRPQDPTRPHPTGPPRHKPSRMSTAHSPPGNRGTEQEVR